jgi:ketosteroid isomerase-like protein
MEPRELVTNWVSAFNRADADEVAKFYAEHVVNHQVGQDPITGRDAIREMFAWEFARATMVCQIENIFPARLLQRTFVPAPAWPAASNRIIPAW